jgi:acetoin utilization deacetylase AcuC-like enzyme
MTAGAGNVEYTQAFSEKVLPAINDYRPEMILVSAGFDAHQDDPLGSINLSTEHYQWMTEALMDCANQHCGNRILSVLEGGYHLDALAHSVSTHIGTLAGISADP